MKYSTKQFLERELGSKLDKIRSTVDKLNGELTKMELDMVLSDLRDYAEAAKEINTALVWERE